jgi:hypothetical protein
MLLTLAKLYYGTLALLVWLLLEDLYAEGWRKGWWRARGLALLKQQAFLFGAALWWPATVFWVWHRGRRWAR